MSAPIVAALEAVKQSIARGEVASVSFELDEVPPMDELAIAAHQQFWRED